MIGPGILGALAQLGYARAQLLAGDTINARKAYESFLRLWADADPTIPVLARARSEYRSMGSS